MLRRLLPKFLRTLRFFNLPLRWLKIDRERKLKCCVPVSISLIDKRGEIIAWYLNLFMQEIVGRVDAIILTQLERSKLIYSEWWFLRQVKLGFIFSSFKICFQNSSVVRTPDDFLRKTSKMINRTTIWVKIVFLVTRASLRFLLFDVW